MEFLKNHKQITNEENKKLKEFTIKNFQNYKSEGRSPEYAIDNARSLIWENFTAPNFINKYSDNFESFYTLFWQSFDDYSPNADVPYLILKNEIFDKYQKTDISRKINNRQYDEDFDNLTFENFVIYLLKYDAAKKAESRLLRNSELYKLFFINDYYKYFTFEKFDGHVVNSDLYRKIFSKFYPNSTIPVAIEKINEWNTPYYEIIEEAPKEIKSEKEKNNYSKIDDFELEEKYLILHAFYRMIESKTFDSSKFDLTEFLRMIIICQNIEDRTIFEKNYTKKFYKSVKDGLDYFANVSNKTKIKKRLISKLTDLNLNKLADEVKGLKI